MIFVYSGVVDLPRGCWKRLFVGKRRYMSGEYINSKIGATERVEHSIAFGEQKCVAARGEEI